MPRFILMCAGEGTRWTGETPKHLVDVEGEVLLHRTVRQLIERGQADVWIAHPDPAYDVEGATRFAPDPDRRYDVDKFWSARAKWVPDTRHLYGDVYYTDDAMDRIALDPPKAAFGIYGRRFRSEITGCPHGEVFAFCFTDLAYCGSVCQELRTLSARGSLRRGGSWELYQMMQGRKPNPYGRQMFDENWTQIDDWTDDFDSVEEYEEWKRRRA